MRSAAWPDHTVVVKDGAWTLRHHHNLNVDEGFGWTGRPPTADENARLVVAAVKELATEWSTLVAVDLDGDDVWSSFGEWVADVGPELIHEILEDDGEIWIDAETVVKEAADGSVCVVTSWCLWAGRPTLVSPLPREGGVYAVSLTSDEIDGADAFVEIGERIGDLP